LQSIRLAADAQAALVRYPWPGNVRELEHLIGRSALKALANNRERRRILTLSAADLALSPDTADHAEALAAATAPQTQIQAAGLDFRSAVTAFERAIVVDTLARHNQNWAAAARELGVDRANLNRLAKRLGLK
jgi:anaerobic nitric oxide reductase transcription regulator